MIFTDYSTQPLKYYTVFCVVLITTMKIRGKANISSTGKFALLGILLILGIVITQGEHLSCTSCRTSLAKCDFKTGVCKSNCRRTSLCKNKDDLCLATWSWRRNKFVMFTSCFRRPPFSNSSQYDAKCKAEILNGTRTCLCQGNNCNRNPIEPFTNRRQPVASQSETKKGIKRPRVKQVVMDPENTTKGSSISPAAREKIPEQSETTIQVPKAAWISLVVILLPFTITVFIHCLRSCTKGHLERELLNKTSESELDEESVKESFGSDSSIEREEVLAQGKFSEVWKGSWKGKSIAIKIFPPAAISSWRREHHMYSILLGKHSNILQMVSLKSQQIGDLLCLVTEFCENGSLRDYLLRTRGALRWREAVRLASGITNGVAYLHSGRSQSESKVPIAHRDLKSTNVLVRTDGTCVISDFGLAMSLDSIEDASKNLQVGTYRYMSPEELLATVSLNSIETFKQMDVYSMALVLWEVMSQCDVTDSEKHYYLAFEDFVGENATLSNMLDVVVAKNCRPHLPNNSNDHEGLALFCQTVEECWDPDPEARLTADCAQTRLQELLLTSKSA